MHIWTPKGFQMAAGQIGRSDPKEAKRQRERERYAKMTDQQKDEKNKKRREAYQRKKELEDITTIKEDNGSVAVHPKLVDTNARFTSMRNHLMPPTSLANTSSWITSSDELREAKRRRERVRYANMTHEEKIFRFHRQYLQDALRRETLSQEHIEARKERQRVHNMTPERKQAMKDREKARCGFQRKTLHKESITKENPMLVNSTAASEALFVSRLFCRAFRNDGVVWSDLSLLHEDCTFRAEYMRSKPSCNLAVYDMKDETVACISI
ncbi:hypothetical protein EJB05_26404, partial [Eragrostis curvula]